MRGIRKSFFDHILARNRALDLTKQGQIVNIEPPERLWDFIDHVGVFLLEHGAINYKDIEAARDMAKDYEDRLAG